MPPPSLGLVCGLHYLFIFFYLLPPPPTLCYVWSCFSRGKPWNDEQCVHFWHTPQFQWLNACNHDAGRKIASLRTTELERTWFDPTEDIAGLSESPRRAKGWGLSLIYFSFSLSERNHTMTYDTRYFHMLWLDACNHNPQWKLAPGRTPQPVHTSFMTIFHPCTKSSRSKIWRMILSLDLFVFPLLDRHHTTMNSTHYFDIVRLRLNACDRNIGCGWNIYSLMEDSAIWAPTGPDLLGKSTSWSRWWRGHSVRGLLF